MQNLLNTLLNLIHPCYCLLCHNKTTETQLVCQDCSEKLPWQQSSCIRCAYPLTNTHDNCCGSCLKEPPIFNYTLAPLNYTAPITKLVTAFKFNQQLTHGRALAQLFLLHWRQLPAEKQSLPECLIPVPLHPKRLRQRGFNQALELASFLGKELKLPVLTDACYRLKNTAAQSSLSAQERALNVKDAFVINHSLPYSHIALVDDVMTTGNTATVLAQAWRQTGIKKIDVWCCARVSPAKK